MDPRVMPRIALELGPESALALPLPVGMAGTDKSDMLGAPVCVTLVENEVVVVKECVVEVELECVVDVCRELEVVFVFDVVFDAVFEDADDEGISWMDSCWSPNRAAASTQPFLSALKTAIGT
jgi:hypothetical protein